MLYDATVPVFDRYLGRLAQLLDRAEAHARAQAIDADALLNARLAPTMLPFAKQVVIAANFSVRACAPLVGRPLPPDEVCEPGFDGLRRHLERTRAFVARLTPRDFDGSETRRCTSHAGEADVVLEGSRFLFDYALPNFFFHLTTAYAILRQQGVPIGKADFDGFHRYSG